MKKQVLLGLATVLTMSTVAFAQAKPTARKVQDVIREASEKASKNSSLKGMNAEHARKAREIISTEIVKLGENKVAENEIKLAMARELKITDSAGQATTVSVYEIARTIGGAKRALDQINRNELPASEKERLEATEEFLSASAQSLSLLAKTSEGRGTLSADAQLNVNVLNKEISLTKETLGMSTAEIKSRTKVLQKFVEKKSNPDMNGDVAVDLAYRDLYGVEAAKKKKELEGCN